MFEVICFININFSLNPIFLFFILFSSLKNDFFTECINIFALINSVKKLFFGRVNFFSIINAMLKKYRIESILIKYSMLNITPVLSKENPKNL